MEAGRSKATKNSGLWSYGILLLLLGIFFVTFFNRFAGLRSGAGEFSGGMALLGGRLPYRDYFSAGPPLNTLKAALLLKVFGPYLMVDRIAGVAERLVLGVMLLAWLRRIVSGRPALLGTLVAMVLSAGDRTDPIASYNHDAIFWAVMGGLLASSALGERRLSRVVLLGVAAGAASGLCLLTKQTVGLGAVACLGIVPAALLLWRHRKPQAAAWLSGFVPGSALPVGVALLVLARLNILRAALEMLFVKGPSAKAGRPVDFLLRVGLVAWDNLGWVVLGGFWLLLCWRYLIRGVEETATKATPKSEEMAQGHWLGRLLVVGLLLLILVEELDRLPTLHDLSKSVVYASSAALLLLLVLLLRAVARRKGSVPPVALTQEPGEERMTQMLLLTCLSLAVAGMLGLSWPAFEAMLLPGLGLLVALVVSETHGRQRLTVYGVLLFLVTMQWREKLNLPFGFDLQDEGTVASTTQRSVLPAMAGLRLPPASVALIDGVVRLVHEKTPASSHLFTFPELGLLYTLSDRHPPTFAESHNMDVIPDKMAEREAGRLLANPPEVLVYYRESEVDLRGQERLWRHGRRSGQRALIAAIEELLPRYVLADCYVLRPGDPPIGVYLLRSEWMRAVPPGSPVSHNPIGPSC